MSRNLLDATTVDVCLSSQFPDLSKFMDELESMNVSFQFIVVDINKRELKRSFSTVKPVEETIIKDSLALREKILSFFKDFDPEKFKRIGFFYKLSKDHYCDINSLGTGFQYIERN